MIKISKKLKNKLIFHLKCFFWSKYFVVEYFSKKFTGYDFYTKFDCFYLIRDSSNNYLIDGESIYYNWILSEAINLSRRASTSWVSNFSILHKSDKIKKWTNEN